MWHSPLTDTNHITKWLIGPEGLTGNGEAVLMIGGLALVCVLWQRRHHLASDCTWKPGHLEAKTMDSAGLPSGVASYFRLFQPALEELGLDLVGDYQMVHGCLSIYARYFAAPDGDVFAEVAVQRPAKPGFLSGSVIRALTLITVFDDDCCLQTTNLRGREGDRHQPPQIVYKFRPNLAPAMLWIEHAEAISEYVESHDAQPVRYAPDQVAEVAAYYAQVQRAYLRSIGLIDSPSVYDLG